MSAFVSILLVTRMQEIARLAALNSEIPLLLLFIACQIPYILPLAIPISTLIASFLLMQNLSHTHELTAFKAAALSLKTICSPLFFIAGVLSILNFLIVSELTPRCRLYSHELLYKAKTINPLFLMKKSKFLRLEDSYADMHMTELGKEAKEVVFAVPNKAHKRLSLMLAKELKTKDRLLKGKNVAIISNIDPNNPSHFDHLIIENQAEMSTSAKALTALMQKRDDKIGTEHLPFKKNVSAAFFSPDLKPKTVKRAQYELVRRFFFPTATFCFTFLGIAFGMDIGRGKRKRGLLSVLILASLSFLLFLSGKSFEFSPIKAALCFFSPIPILLFFSLWHQKKMIRGIE